MSFPFRSPEGACEYLMCLFLSDTHEQELQALHQGEAIDRCDLHGELEAVQTEHAQRLGEVQQEQRKLKSRLDKLRQQGCKCKKLNTEPHQETIYAKQVLTNHTHPHMSFSGPSFIVLYFY